MAFLVVADHAICCIFVAQLAYRVVLSHLEAWWGLCDLLHRLLVFDDKFRKRRKWIVIEELESLQGLELVVWYFIII